MILFVDIDGCVMGYCGSRIKPAAREALRRAKAAGWKLVLHSTWRVGMLNEARQLFADAGVPLDDHCGEHASKRAAIAAYLFDNFGDDWPRAVVVDDHDIEPMDGVTIVKVDGKTGLTWTDISGHVK